MPGEMAQSSQPLSFEGRLERALVMDAIFVP